MLVLGDRLQWWHPQLCHHLSEWTLLMCSPICEADGLNNSVVLCNAKIMIVFSLSKPGKGVWKSTWSQYWLLLVLTEKEQNTGLHWKGSFKKGKLLKITTFLLIPTAPMWAQAIPTAGDLMLWSLWHLDVATWQSSCRWNWSRRDWPQSWGRPLVKGCK